MNYILLDTRGLLLHAYHRSTSKTIETTDGFIPSWEDGIAEFVEAYLDPILASVAPRQVIACFDGGNTARRLLYFDYKAKRGQRDKDENPIRSEQIKLLMEKGQRLLAYLGCRTVRVPGEEADDLIGLLVSRLEADSFIIYTRDKDLLQLVSDKVMVIQGGTPYSSSEVSGLGAESDLDGTPFDLIALMKAIVGDSSDEYPGVKGCGPKFFETLLQTYGADVLRQLRDMIETWNHPKGVKPQSNGCKLMDKLIENWDDLLLFYKVAKINPANCYGANNGKRKNPEWYVRVPDGKKVHEILGPIGISRPQWDRFFPTEKLIDATRADQMQDIAGQILASPVVSYDFETSDKLQHKPFREYDKNFVDVLSQELTSISINYGDNLQHTIYIPFDHKDTANLSTDWARWILQVLANVQPRAVVQNAAFELSVALTQLQEARRAPFDTAIMSMYVDENEENHLKGMSKLWLNYTQATYKEVTQGRAMHELTAQEALSYGCDDSLVTGHLFDLFRHIMQLEGSWAFYAENEVDWALDSAHYFVEGTDVDYQTLHAFHTEAKKKVAEGMEQMHASLAEHCNAQKTAEIVQPLATALLDEWWGLEGGKYGEDIAKAEAARQRLWEQAWNGCFYVPPSRTVEIKFSPTPVQLTAVASLIDKAIPRIEKVTQKAIEEWDIAVSDALEVAEKSRVVEPLAHEFHEALFRARKSLKKTDSVEYHELSNLCLKVLHERGNTKATLSGDQLNTNSPKQMQQLLYGKLELPIRRRSKVQQGSSRAKLGLQGGPATGIKAIQAAFVHDVNGDDWRKDVLEAYFDVAKTSQEISLYYETYPLLVHPRSGKIHPQIKNCGTVTRRPSGSAPNVLQVAKGPLRTLFRGGEYGDGDRVYVCIDFAAQELVITACESKDPVMLDAFMSNPRKDLHSLTSTGFAHEILPRLGVPITNKLSYEDFMKLRHSDDPEIKSAVNKVRNKYGKSANFLIAYLGGPSTLAENLLIPLDEAKEIMNSVFDLYARMQPWQQETIEFAKSRGYTLTAYGNRRHAPKDLWASDKGLASRAGRQVVNATVQGTAADILKVVLTEMVRREMRQRYRLRALKPVYDEVSASVPVELAADYAQELIEVMSVTPPGYPVGMKVDLSLGKTWGSVIEVEDTSRAGIEQALATVLK